MQLVNNGRSLQLKCRISLHDFLSVALLRIVCGIISPV